MIDRWSHLDYKRQLERAENDRDSLLFCMILAVAALMMGCVVLARAWF